MYMYIHSLPQIGRSSGHVKIHTCKRSTMYAYAPQGILAYVLTDIHLIPIVVPNSISKCFKLVIRYFYSAVDFLHCRI